MQVNAKDYFGKFMRRRRCFVGVRILQTDESERRKRMLRHHGAVRPRGHKRRNCKKQTYYRWRKEYGGLKLDQAKRLKELEQENARLKRLGSELSLEKQVLKGVAEGNF